eukprot:TRINITY_DN2283_c1_g1_i1.p1 TRINITY_DN2283_c1_g1~~TRINITY_DN2283_c1_g1_i1.p1  ORF type:complete len:445 (+),score=80.03 TRINITY_DN2283_c1_g1_i1:128-1462(+)
MRQRFACRGVRWHVVSVTLGASVAFWPAASAEEAGYHPARETDAAVSLLSALNVDDVRDTSAAGLIEDDADCDGSSSSSSSIVGHQMALVQTALLITENLDPHLRQKGNGTTPSRRPVGRNRKWKAEELAQLARLACVFAALASALATCRLMWRLSDSSASGEVDLVLATPIVSVLSAVGLLLPDLAPLCLAAGTVVVAGVLARFHHFVLLAVAATPRSVDDLADATAMQQISVGSLRQGRAFMEALCARAGSAMLSHALPAVGFLEVAVYIYLLKRPELLDCAGHGLIAGVLMMEAVCFFCGQLTLNAAIRSVKKTHADVAMKCGLDDKAQYCRYLKFAVKLFPRVASLLLWRIALGIGVLDPSWTATVATQLGFTCFGCTICAWEAWRAFLPCDGTAKLEQSTSPKYVEPVSTRDAKTYTRAPASAAAMGAAEALLFAQAKQ